ncbi:ImmA/IrrE family metallo-endopeptidase [Jeotgalibaca porci]|uniref:ImmA/IrrE family metallo-endopeptidase n=1 Tax=Jeotgalibaca porci TaxID=1868793 RepID=UPI0035A06250
MINSSKLEYQNTDFDSYVEYDTVANEILGKASRFTGINVIDLHSIDIINYFRLTYNIQFINYTKAPPIFDSYRERLQAQVPKLTDCIKMVDPVFSEKTSGFTTIVSGEYVVFLNLDVVDKSPQRYIFTVLHELVHIYHHLSNKYIRNLFANSNVEEDYPIFFNEYENQANYIASILCVNDWALIDNLNNEMTFNELCTEYQMSGPAVYNRLKNFLQHTLQLNRYERSRVLYNYRYNNDFVGMHTIVRIWITETDIM